MADNRKKLLCLGLLTLFAYKHKFLEAIFDSFEISGCLTMTTAKVSRDKCCLTGGRRKNGVELRT